MKNEMVNAALLTDEISNINFSIKYAVLIGLLIILFLFLCYHIFCGLELKDLLKIKRKDEK